MNVHIWSECQDKDKPVWVIFVLLDLVRDVMHYEKGCMFDEQKDTRNLLDILWSEYLLITDILWREYRYLLILLYMYSLIDIKCALLKQIWSRIRYRIQPLWCIEVCTMRSRVPHLNCIPIFSCFNEIMFCKISLFIYIFMSLLVYSW